MNNMLKVKLKFSAYMAHIVYDSFYEEEVKLDGESCFLVETIVPNDMWLYSFVLSFAEYVEVIEPQCVREKIKEHIEKITKLYI